MITRNELIVTAISIAALIIMSYTNQISGQVAITMIGSILGGIGLLGAARKRGGK